ncbi:hypothetical protein [Streptosporangium pseudovulgare]|uniref:Uncharacterized protein n=1 Tax=Streptosporangium pseudovulgare TaxID=35765 RepID=A0ABQ2RJQ7_9ACTN|nr:hypothetical protein [Streptosporangium pseudovulgare]GGQ30578.1 hypothetical protein GCM10010140_70830 [Streptosporangium pseudovulgare]
MAGAWVGGRPGAAPSGTGPRPHARAAGKRRAAVRRRGAPPLDDLARGALGETSGTQRAREPDEDFPHALEYAMPFTGGLGLGVGRRIMMPIFPLVRSRG